MRDEPEASEILRLTDRQLVEYMQQNPDTQLQALPLRPTLINSVRGRRAKAKAYRVAYVSPANEIAEKN